VEKVLTCPLLNEDLVTNAKNFLFFISYGSSEPLKISELDTLTEKFEHLKTQNSDVIWGHAKDDTLGNAIKLSVIITHYNTREKPNMVNLTDHRQEISSEENRIPGSSHVEDDADNFLENMKKPVDSQSPFNFVEGDRMYIPQNDNVKSNFDVQPRQPDNNIDSSFRFEPQTQTIKNATPTIPQTKPVSTFNDPRYEDNNEFSFLTETPAILRKRRDDQNEIQAMTMTHNIPEFEIEDDTQALFKDIPD